MHYSQRHATTFRAEKHILHPPVVGHLNRLAMQDMAGCRRSMIKKAALWRGLK